MPNPLSTSDYPTARLRFLDAARGSVMLFVFISHFATAYFAPGDRRGWALADLGLIASPTFMLISGLTVALLYRTRPREFDGLRLKLMDRAAFLLLVAHPFMILGCWEQMRSTRMIFITDVVALNMLVMPWLLTRTVARTRVLMAAALLVCTWVVTLAWIPRVPAESVLVETLFGSVHPTVYASAFPLVPWLAVALLGTAVGEWLGRLLLEGDGERLWARLARLSAVAVGAGASAKAAFVVAAPHLSGRALSIAAALTSPTQKFPPSPAYIVFYGGVGLGVMSLIMLADARRRFTPLLSGAAILGQNALFMFVVQFYVYETVIYTVSHHWGLHPGWPMLLSGSVAAITMVTFEWHARGGRRFITVGLPMLLDRWHGDHPGAGHVPRPKPVL